MNKFFETVYALSNIKRFSTHQVNHVQNVAMHSFNCAMIAMYVVDVDKIECDKGVLLQKVLFHDLPEGTLGDIPAPTRNYSKELHAKIKEVESEMMAAVFKDLPVNYTKWTTEAKMGPEGEIVALADLIERLIYLCMEKRSGNQVTNDVYADTAAKLKTKSFRELLKKYPTAGEIIFHYLSKVQA